LGYWGLGIGYWGLGLIPNPQSPIPKIFKKIYMNIINKINFLNYFNLIIKI